MAGKICGLSVPTLCKILGAKLIILYILEICYDAWFLTSGTSTGLTVIHGVHLILAVIDLIAVAWLLLLFKKRSISGLEPWLNLGYIRFGANAIVLAVFVILLIVEESPFGKILYSALICLLLLALPAVLLIMVFKGRGELEKVFTAVGSAIRSVI